jgi:hypothetical protein
MIVKYLNLKFYGELPISAKDKTTSKIQSTPSKLLTSLFSYIENR